MKEQEEVVAGVGAALVMVERRKRRSPALLRGIAGESLPPLGKVSVKPRCGSFGLHMA